MASNRLHAATLAAYRAGTSHALSGREERRILRRALLSATLAAGQLIAS